MRKKLYLGPHVIKEAESRSLPLSTTVNVLVERYRGMVDRSAQALTLSMDPSLYRSVLADIGRPLTSVEIAEFRYFVERWLREHPEFPREAAKTALAILSGLSHHELVALVDKMERR